MASTDDTWLSVGRWVVLSLCIVLIIAFGISMYYATQNGYFDTVLSRRQVSAQQTTFERNFSSFHGSSLASRPSRAPPSYTPINVRAHMSVRDHVSEPERIMMRSVHSQAPSFHSQTPSARSSTPIESEHASPRPSTTRFKEAEDELSVGKIGSTRDGPVPSAQSTFYGRVSNPAQERSTHSEPPTNYQGVNATATSATNTVAASSTAALPASKDASELV